VTDRELLQEVKRQLQRWASELRRDTWYAWCAYVGVPMQTLAEKIKRHLETTVEEE